MGEGACDLKVSPLSRDFSIYALGRGGGGEGGGVQHLGKFIVLVWSWAKYLDEDLLGGWGLGDEKGTPSIYDAKPRIWKEEGGRV